MPASFDVSFSTLEPWKTLHDARLRLTWLQNVPQIRETHVPEPSPGASALASLVEFLTQYAFCPGGTRICLRSAHF